MEPAVTDSLKSATLWGGVGGGETRQIAVPRSQPVNGYSFRTLLPQITMDDPLNGVLTQFVLAVPHLHTERAV